MNLYCQRSDQDIVVNDGKGCREVKKIRYFCERIALMRWYWMQRTAVSVEWCLQYRQTDES